MNVLLLPLDQVEVFDRLRVVDPEQVDQIAVSMRQVGQLTPITVAKLLSGHYRLVTGAHRYAAAGKAGLDVIKATLTEGSNDQLRLQEIDENLYRHELNPYDQAAFLAERKEVYERLHPTAKRGGDRRSAQTAESAVWSKSFAADVAETIGLSQRTVFQAIARFNALAPEARAVVAGTSLARTGSDLDALTKIPRDRQVQVASWVLEQRKFGQKVGIADARIMVLSERTQAKPDAGYNALLGAWRKGTGAERRRFLNWLVQNEPQILDPYLQGREDDLAGDGESPANDVVTRDARGAA